jgi:hypothetical protein
LEKSQGRQGSQPWPKVIGVNIIGEKLYTSTTNHLFLIFSGIPFEQQKNVILAGLFYRNIISAFMIPS